MAKEKATRNKTIDTSLTEGQIYLDRCIEITQKQNDIYGVVDKTIIGNMLDVCPLLPPKSVDLTMTLKSTAKRRWLLYQNVFLVKDKTNQRKNRTALRDFSKGSLAVLFALGELYCFAVIFG